MQKNAGAQLGPINIKHWQSAWSITGITSQQHAQHNQSCISCTQPSAGNQQRWRQNQDCPRKAGANAQDARYDYAGSQHNQAHSITEHNQTQKVAQHRAMSFCYLNIPRELLANHYITMCAQQNWV
jgi:hypothetical protein